MRIRSMRLQSRSFTPLALSGATELDCPGRPAFAECQTWISNERKEVKQDNNNNRKKTTCFLSLFVRCSNLHNIKSHISVHGDAVLLVEWAWKISRNNDRRMQRNTIALCVCCVYAQWTRKKRLRRIEPNAISLNSLFFCVCFAGWWAAGLCDLLGYAIAMRASARIHLWVLGAKQVP